MVRGDLIVPTSDRIMTRSRTKQSKFKRLVPPSTMPSDRDHFPRNLDPDQYTIVSVPLKITKVLIEELSSASGNLSLSVGDLAASTEDGAGNDDDDSEGDGDWEDIASSATNTLDLGLGTTKQQLMAFGEGGTSSIMSTRQRDDETQAYLLEFFRDLSTRNIGGFQEIYSALTVDEQQKLTAIVGGSGGT